MTSHSNDDIHAYLNTMIEAHTHLWQSKGLAEDAPYVCMEQYVLDNGGYMPWREQPADLPPGEPKDCFANAADLALVDSDLTYCEGYAYAKGLIPVLHAWCVDVEGFVIDNTPVWSNGGSYFGVMFHTDDLLDKIMRTKYYGMIDNWQEHWPLLRGETV